MIKRSCVLFLFLFALNSFITSFKVSAQNSTCDIASILQAFTSAGYIELTAANTSCYMYFYSSQTQSASAAQASAANLGGNLVSIESQAENDAIQQALIGQGISGVVWIGLHDATGGGAGNWQWYDGSPLTYTNWNPGEPNNGSGIPGVSEDCVQMVISSGQWNDLVCDAQPFGQGPTGTSVIKVNLCPEVTLTNNTTICVGQNIQLNASTIFGSQPYDYTWNPAAGLSNAGISNPTASPTQTTTYTVTSTDRYSCSGTGDITITVDSCILDYNCNIPLIQQTMSSAGYLELPTAHTECYMYFYNSQSLSASAAQTAAQNLGTTLVSIESQAENDAVQQALINAGITGVVWIGLRDMTGGGAGNWQWYDGTPMTYTNWNPGEPNNGSGLPGVAENCVEMVISSGRWNDLVCNAEPCFFGACTGPQGASVIKVNMCPELTVTPDQAFICAGQTVNFNSSTIFGSIPYSYTWTPADGLSATNIPNPNASPVSTVTYTVQVSDRYECTVSEQVAVTVSSPPLAEFFISSPVCQNDVATIIYTGDATPNTVFNWNFDGATILEGTGEGPYNLTWNTAGLVTVSLTIEEDGCLSLPFAQTVDVLPGITADTGPDVTTCSGVSVVIGSTPNPDYTYAWFPNNGLDDPNSPNPTLTLLNTTGSDENYQYILVASYQDCNAVDTLNVTITPSSTLDVTVSGSTDLCPGESITLTGEPGFNDYDWQNGETGAELVVTESGTYVLTALAADGCISVSQPIEVTVNEAPQVNFDIYGISCQGASDGSVSVSVSGNFGSYTLNWDTQPPQSDSVLTGITAGDYNLTIEDASGCIFNETITIDDALPLEVGAIVDNVSCNGFDNGSITPDVSGGTLPYTYLWSTGSTDSILQNLSPSNYSLTVTDTNGCVGELEDISVSEPAPYQVNIASSVYEMNAGEQILINATYEASGSNVGFNWTPSEGLNCTDCLEPIASPFENTTYILTISDGQGCEASDTTTVIIREEPVLYIPNIFSPNEDGVNDVFYVYATNVKTFNLRIFDRWGGLVYASEDINEGWDGTFVGNKLEQGVYVYSLTITFLTNTMERRKGSITLVR